MNTEDIQLTGELIFTFNNFEHWVAKASKYISVFPKDERIICVDTQNRILTGGLYFQTAKKRGTFPVKAYRLVRVSE